MYNTKGNKQPSALEELVGAKEVAMSPGALSDLRVLELGEFVSAPWCGKLLASMGSEVIKVEPLEVTPANSAAQRFLRLGCHIYVGIRKKSLLGNLDTNLQQIYMNICIIGYEIE